MSPDAGALVHLFLVLFMYVGRPSSAFPVAQQPLHQLDLELLEYNHKDSTDNKHDLVLEFRSKNISGVVQLKRVPSAARPTPSRNRHRNRNRHHDRDDGEYDQTGAMYFAVSVVSLYGLSIGVLVAFSVRRDTDEDEVKSFQRSWGKMDHLMEKQEKQRAKKLMTRAIIAIHQPRRTSSVCATVSREAVLMALAPVARAHEESLLGRRCSREAPVWNNLSPPMLCIQEDTDSPKSKAAREGLYSSNEETAHKEVLLDTTVNPPVNIDHLRAGCSFECEEEAGIWQGTPPLASLEETFGEDQATPPMSPCSIPVVYSIEEGVELWKEPVGPQPSPVLSEPTSECARIHLGLPSPTVPYMDEDEGPGWPHSPDSYNTYL